MNKKRLIKLGMFLRPAAHCYEGPTLRGNLGLPRPGSRYADRAAKPQAAERYGPVTWAPAEPMLR